ncbi:MAG TPA: beta-lactamase-like protein 2 [Deltaproteobacteria bacterium]|nr:beta-lactamase-like protein 2 [Deltaproteobacteria bacterium]
MSANEPPILEGTRLPDVETLSTRVTAVLGQNPGLFTGPGTNTYLVGTGPRRLLLDTGSGHAEYMPILEEAIAGLGCREIEGIVLTHAHPDHIGGVRQVRAHFGPIPVYKQPWPPSDPAAPDARGRIAHPDDGAEGPFEILGDGDVVETEGARLRALFTPGHSPDHLCFLLEEERNLFSGDNVLGIGTTVIPSESGSLVDYMESLERLGSEAPDAIYPAHGPCIRNGRQKIAETLQHRREREQQVLAALAEGDRDAMAMVRRIYVGYPERLHPAAAQSVMSHLKKLEEDGRVRAVPTNGGKMRWEPI